MPCDPELPPAFPTLQAWRPWCSSSLESLDSSSCRALAAASRCRFLSLALNCLYITSAAVDGTLVKMEALESLWIHCGGKLSRLLGH